jgi:hypothetical protein
MPGPTHTLIASNVLTSNASTITFSSIPQIYRDLVVVAQGRTIAGNSDQFALRFNGDTSNNYRIVWAEGDGTSATSGGSNGTSWIITSQGYSAVDPTNGGHMVANIFDYSITDKNKTVLTRAGNGGAGTTMMCGIWVSNSAITSVEVRSTAVNYVAGTSFYLYGIIA